MNKKSFIKKLWKYFFQFFMLFLAVFCGFMAENFREERTEKQRAKELAKSFYEELKNDSVTAVLKSQNRIRQENALVALADYIKDSSLQNFSKPAALNFIYGVYFRSTTIFEPRTVELEQLQNSGSLRYFKNDSIKKLIGDLSVAIHNINDRQQLETQLRVQYLNPIIMNHYDYDFESRVTDNHKLDIFSAIEKYEKSSEVIPFHFKSIDKFDKNQNINLFNFFARAAVGSTRRTHLMRYMEINAAILRELRKEYNLR